MPRDRERSIAQEMRYCRHYIGGAAITEADPVCRAGVKLNDLGVEGKDRPCIKWPDHPARDEACASLSRITREEAEASVDEGERKIGNFLKCQPAVSAWRNKKRPFGKAGTIPCPICAGTLHLRQANSNGHVWGKCDTTGCVEWME